jgi:hypothetical protein
MVTLAAAGCRLIDAAWNKARVMPGFAHNAALSATPRQATFEL